MRYDCPIRKTSFIPFWFLHENKIKKKKKPSSVLTGCASLLLERLNKHKRLALSLSEVASLSEVCSHAYWLCTYMFFFFTIYFDKRVSSTCLPITGPSCSHIMAGSLNADSSSNSWWEILNRLDSNVFCTHRKQNHVETFLPSSFLLITAASSKFLTIPILLHTPLQSCG